MIDLSLRVPPSLAVALNAATPVPEGPGAIIWSTTTASLLSWDGTKWAALGGGSAASQAWDPVVWVAGKPSVGAVISGFKVARALTVPANFVGSQVHVETAGTTAAVFTLSKNGSAIGTITITGTTVAMATSGGVDQTFAVGDVFRLAAPSPQDATLAGVGFNFLLTRT